MIINETDERFYVAESTIPGAGRGLFAKVAMATGDRLAVLGVLVASGSLSDELTGYADEYKLRVGDLLLIPMGYGGLVNHSHEPNLEKQIEGEQLYLRLTRDVAAGDELSFAYSDYALQRYGIAPLPGDRNRPRPEVLATNSTSTFSNNGTPGVNCVVALQDGLLVQNIGRNFEVWRLDAQGNVVDKALRDETAFPGQDVPSQLDIDVHAVFEPAAGGSLLIVNHYGRLRSFSKPLPMLPSRLQPEFEAQFLGDTERLLLVDDCLICSSPRGQLTPDPAQPGIFISQPLSQTTCSSSDTPPLARRQELADWGVVTALAAADGLLAVASAGRLGLFETQRTPEGPTLQRLLWQTGLPYYLQWLDFGADGSLLAAGYDAAGVDPEGSSWEDCRGGGLSVFSPAGRRLLDASLPDDTAWGYGTDALVRSGSLVYALDRSGGLHALDTRSGELVQLFDAPFAGPSLGIGHCDIRDGVLYAGFSRGDYRLFRYAITP